MYTVLLHSAIYIMSPAADERRSVHLIGPRLFQSYGGFVTAHALGDEHSDVFKCGISVAPVTDFRYYGSHFELFVYLLFKFESIVISDEVHDCTYSVYQMHVSVADTAYTERYLGLAHSTEDAIRYEVSLTVELTVEQA